MNGMRADLAGTTWRKSSYSGPNGGDCVEVAVTTTVAGIRDSKAPEGPVLVLGVEAWRAFLADQRA